MIAIAALASAVSLAGCVETRIIRPESDWVRLRDFADAPRDSTSGEPARRGRRWAIELASFDGPDRLAEAYRFADTARTEAGIADVWFIDRGADTAVYAGRFSRSNHPDAQAQLKTVRAARINGDRPFRRAALVEVSRVGGERGEFDLARFSGYRTLLLEAFDRNHGPDFRADAERAAAELREKHADHELNFKVYYYHGPNQSLVTAGLFTEADFVPVNGVDSYGPRIRELQGVFPYSKKNDKFIATSRGKDGEYEFQKTVIVRVP
ncbi:MAG: hypothetical protein AAFX76_07640 [Planctomycetota bacterium]